MKVGYVRISTKEQNTARQDVLMKRLGVEKVYTDKQSGKDTDRPELQKLMEFVREGDTVVVESFSRFARNLKDLLELIATLEKRQVQFVSQKENVDTSTPQGKLREHKAEMMELTANMGEAWSEDNLVFKNSRGNIVYNRNLQGVLDRIYDKAGIEGATMHTLRHTYATRCFEAGVDIKAISEQLGHANVKTTYNVYVHLLDDTKAKEIDKLEELDKFIA